MLAAIRKGAKLKKVEVEEKVEAVVAKPAPKAPAAAAPMDMNSMILAAKLKKGGGGGGGGSTKIDKPTDIHSALAGGFKLKSAKKA